MNDRKDSVAFLGGCLSIIIAIVFIISFFFPGNKIIDFLALVFTVQNIVYAVFGLILVFYLFWIYSVPTKIRKLIVTLSLLGISIVALYGMNFYFHWGWNFPDIFGVVSGTAGLAFALLDRYVGSR